MKVSGAQIEELMRNMEAKINELRADLEKKQAAIRKASRHLRRYEQPEALAALQAISD